jgi:hypothetical protein
LALHADSLNLTREEEKAYSMNFGHGGRRPAKRRYRNA